MLQACIRTIGDTRNHVYIVHQTALNPSMMKRKQRKKTISTTYSSMIRVRNQHSITHILIVRANRRLMLIHSVCSCCVVLEEEQQPWRDWRYNSDALKDATGLDRYMFDQIYEMVEQELIEKRMKMRSAKHNTAHISTRNLLAITIHWLRKAPSFHSLSAHLPPFSRWTIQRAVYDVINILNNKLVPLMIVPISSSAPSSRMPSLENVRLIIDSTFIPLPAAEKGKKYYHKKSPTKAALKFEIACDLSHKIVNVSDCVRGSVHDMKLVRQSGVLKQMNEHTKAIGDKAYIGKLGIITPARKKRKISKEVEKLQDEKARKHELESERAAIENINSRVKQWNVIKHIWEQDYDNFTLINKIVHVVCAIVNLIFQTRPIRHNRQPLEGR